MAGEPTRDCSRNADALLTQGSQELLAALQAKHANKSEPATQLWKENERKALRNGVRPTIFWTKPKQVSYEESIVSALEDPSQKGRKQYATGASYSGEWQDNKKHGYGTHNSSSGNKYEGEWKEGQRHGMGTLWLAEGKGELRKTYAGEWKRGLKNGVGTYWSKNGARYEGTFREGLRHGEGKLFMISGDVYEGNWHHGERCGYGRVTYTIGDIYEGAFCNGLREGPGQFFYAASRRLYVGEWVQDVAKCGMYVDADASATRPSELREVIPVLEMKEADEVLRQQVLRIRAERRDVRAAGKAEPTEMFSKAELRSLQLVFQEACQAAEGGARLPAVAIAPVFMELGVGNNETEVVTMRRRLGLKPDSKLSFMMFVRLAYLLAQLPKV